MSTQEMISFNPPRIAEVPTQPLPQTVCATLEHSGVPYSDQINVTDIAPVFDWMFALQVFRHSFDYSVNDEPGKELTSFNVHTLAEYPSGNPEYMKFTPWTVFPHFTSRWWNGLIGFKLVAIKPPRVTGKILVRYSFDPVGDFEGDTKRRGISKEWDLGQSSECAFDINAPNTIHARQTWIPHTKEVHVDNQYAFLGQDVPIQQWHYGTLRIEAAQRLQPGSIFPDRIRILVFQMFKRAEFYLPTDIRGSEPHFLLVGTALAQSNSYQPAR